MYLFSQHGKDRDFSKYFLFRAKLLYEHVCPLIIKLSIFSLVSFNITVKELSL